MKKIKNKDRILWFYRLRSLKDERHRIQRKERLKRRRRSLQGFSKAKIRSLEPWKREIKVVAPSVFSFLINSEGVIRFINGLDFHFTKKKSVFIDMRNVSVIDYAALASLLAVMFNFKKARIPFNGNFPLDQKANQVLQESGFLYRLFDSSSPKTIYNFNNKDQFVTQNHEGKFDQKLIVDHIIPEVSSTIWGDKRRCPGVYSVILEMIDNTRSHASESGEGVERWWLSINHDEQNKKVTFVFLDYGIGIFTSLAQKRPGDPKRFLFEKLQQRLGTAANEEHLKELVSGTGETSTGLPNRGRGLHGIKLTADRNQINNLFIVSNYAFGRVSEGKYTRNKESFNGTLFYWELCYNNENLG